MTNYEQLFYDQMQDPKFAKAYYDARLERIMSEMLDALKEKIAQNEPKDSLMKLIDSFQQQIHQTVTLNSTGETHRMRVMRS
jgi:hypothetical protein